MGWPWGGEYRRPDATTPSYLSKLPGGGGGVKAGVGGGVFLPGVGGGRLAGG